ncbi:MAG: type VI secretion system baseplate subunit TssF [Gammaproteobacteria bacterium]|nr:type VI secretion system baseplate subunit TssF [Gammaproteobacteria bacterium]
MDSHYFKEELKRLREISVEFAQRNPVLAPALELASSDPDVERLLEGTAFLTAGIQQKLDDDYPQLLHHLAQVLQPNIMQPVPAATIIQFSANRGCNEKIEVKKGTPLESEEVGGSVFRFSTCYQTSVWPLSVTTVEKVVEGEGGASAVTVRVVLDSGGIPLQTLNIDRLRFYLGGDYGGATDLYALLLHTLLSVRVVAEGGDTTTLQAKSLTAAGFAEDELLLPGDDDDLSVFNQIHDFFHFPEKFLFFDLDLSSWTRRAGSRFELLFDLLPTTTPIPPLSPSRFILNATPALNLYSCDAESILIDHHQSDYPLQLRADNPNASLFAVEQVRGVRRGEKLKRIYRSYRQFALEGGGGALYHLKQRRDGAAGAFSLVPTYSRRTALEAGEVLQIKLMATDGVAAQRVQPGQITRHAMGTPQRVTFSNLLTPKGARGVPAESSLLWHLTSHLSLQRKSVLSSATLQGYLNHYANLAAMTSANSEIARSRIEAISDLRVTTSDRLFSGRFYRGQSIEVDLRRDPFISFGDRYLFGSILKELYQSLTPMNYYSGFTMCDPEQEEGIQWPVHLGTEPLN